MQNRYAGDVGDFGKLGLLRVIAQGNLTVGVNWYLTENEEHNQDGKHTTYLMDSKFEMCDLELRGKLGYMVFSGQHCVKTMQELDLIPDCTYVSEYVPVNSKERLLWHTQALQKLRATDVVFLDPDNGLEVKSVPPTRAKSVKYVLRSEVVDYYTQGNSVIFYNHRSHEPDEEYLLRFQRLNDCRQLADALLVGLRFSRGTTRDYLFLVHPEHQDTILHSVECILQGPWARHFKQLVL